MYYVYSKRIDSDIEDQVGYFDTIEEAVFTARFSHCFDTIHGVKDEYYYFIKKEALRK